jgi:hypothetical protein
MGFFNNDFTDHLNKIFKDNDIPSIEDLLDCKPTEYGVITPHEIARWAASRTGQQILRAWGQMPFDDRLRVIFPKAYNFKEGAKKPVQEYSRQEYSATQNNYYGDVVSGDKISIEHGDYVQGDKVINPQPQIQDTPNKPPAYIRHLIDKALLYPDGKRVIRSLDDVAATLKDFVNDEGNQNDIQAKEIKITWSFLQEAFLQPSGEKYSEKSCKDALRMSNY